jgi:hypothetical protein
LFKQFEWAISESLARAIMTVWVLACGLAIFTHVFLPETKGKELEAFY